ncbi:MAG: ABC transporter permease subunit, partial [Bacilli bacterium]|nr:ABC transporter permease subunit [Bacilli bacterium]
IIPIAHSIPLNIVGTLVGAIITERVYAVPGMGKMLTDSINNYNNAMIVALTFIYTALSILGLLLGDILISMIDPRISFEGEGGRK